MENTIKEFPIVDFHIHFVVKGYNLLDNYYSEYEKNFGLEKLNKIKSWAIDHEIEWQKSFNFPKPELNPPDWHEGAKRWEKELERYKLKKVAFVTGGNNDILEKVVNHSPGKFIGFAHHSPENSTAAEDLEKAVTEKKLKGYKVLAPLLKTPLDSPNFKNLWETAEKFRLPVLIHFGILGGGGGIAAGVNINPLSLEPVAKSYPDIPFVVPHFGCGYIRELLQLCWSCNNVYVDTSGNNEWLRWYPEKLSLEDLFKRFYETIGSRRIIFGSDSSWFPRGFAYRYLLDQLRACYSIKIPENDMARIFGGNALDLLEGVKT